jgi:hypothetical protein
LLAGFERDRARTLIGPTVPQLSIIDGAKALSKEKGPSAGQGPKEAHDS